MFITDQVIVSMSPHSNKNDDPNYKRQAPLQSSIYQQKMLCNFHLTFSNRMCCDKAEIINKTVSIISQNDKSFLDRKLQLDTFCILALRFLKTNDSQCSILQSRVLFSTVSGDNTAEFCRLLLVIYFDCDSLFF